MDSFFCNSRNRSHLSPSHVHDHFASLSLSVPIVTFHFWYSEIPSSELSYHLHSLLSHFHSASTSHLESMISTVIILSQYISMHPPMVNLPACITKLYCWWFSSNWHLQTNHTFYAWQKNSCEEQHHACSLQISHNLPNEVVNLQKCKKGKQNSTLGCSDRMFGE